MHRHIIAIFGGAVSGAEAAWQLAQKGGTVVVFDQNLLPYGKIEDGLPKWHVKLRDKEEQTINEKLNHPSIHFVPGIKLGRDLDFEDVARNWGFSAVFLATGAWRDRPLAIPGIDSYLGKGLAYQNSFIYWYNHKHEPGYQGPHYEIEDGALVIGGGLASLDVAKAVMFELVEEALRKRGIETNLFVLERSVAKVLEENGLTLQDLGLRGCTLYYRRRIQDMPLSPATDDSPEATAKAVKVREKILQNFQSKYLFNVESCQMPANMIVEEERLAGLIFQQTRIEEGRAVPVPGTEKPVRAPLVVSSIGSIPEAIDGVPMSGQVYKVLSEDCCRIEGFENVFALGNAVTGRGNIKESLQHGREVALAAAEQYFSEEAYESTFRRAESHANDRIGHIAGRIRRLAAPSDEQRRELIDKVRRLQQKAGYDGDYMAWVKRHLPVRLEEMINH
jgi:ferredoxin/flavodoxin---NADP+ reductase